VKLSASNSFSALVVDDDVLMLEIITTSLHQIGITQTNTAQNGAEGLRYLRAETTPPNCIICDLQMPEMDGIELLRHLAEMNYQGGIILMSGEDKRVLTTVEELANAHHLNILGSLSKPITKQELLAHLSNIEDKIQLTADKPEWSLTPTELIKAISADQIKPYYQPQVSTTDRRVIAVEALARWNHPSGKLMPPPTVFIPLAEQYDLIDLLTERIYTQAIRQAAIWHRSGFDLKVSINLSMDNLSDFELPRRLHTIAEREGVAVDRIVLEITESRLATDHAIALENLARLRLMGFSLSIDDFGTGYSSMELLNNIPFSELKLDRQFVHGAHHNDSSRAILESSIYLAKKLGMTVVAEGVEDQKDWDLIVSLGCDLVQGYYIAKPQPADQLYPLLSH